jgi:hypothetical protein
LGHDVLALQEADGATRALDDELVLGLAADEERILVTRNSRDFAPILVEWARGGRSHAGCILIWSLDHAEPGAIVAAILRLLDRSPGVADWRNMTRAV